MKLLESLIVFFFPELKIPLNVKGLWEADENQAFLTSAKVGLLLITVGHIAHHFLVDVPLKLEPEYRWFSYRMLMSAVALFTLAITIVLSKKESGYLRAPFLIWGVIQSYYQAQTMVWSEKVPYFFSILIPVLISTVARLSPGSTVVYLSLCLAVGIPFWNPEQNDFMIYSAAVVGLAAAVVFRSRMSSDVSAFLAHQEKIKAQKELVQKQIELNEQIKSFFEVWHGALLL